MLDCLVCFSVRPQHVPASATHAYVPSRIANSSHPVACRATKIQSIIQGFRCAISAVHTPGEAAQHRKLCTPQKRLHNLISTRPRGSQSKVQSLSPLAEKQGRVTNWLKLRWGLHKHTALTSRWHTGCTTCDLPAQQNTRPADSTQKRERALSSTVSPRNSCSVSIVCRLSATTELSSLTASSTIRRLGAFFFFRIASCGSSFGPGLLPEGALRAHRAPRNPRSALLGGRRLLLVHSMKRPTALGLCLGQVRGSHSAFPRQAEATASCGAPTRALDQYQAARYAVPSRQAYRCSMNALFLGHRGPWVCHVRKATRLLPR